MHWLDWDEPEFEPPRRVDLFREAVAARKKALVAAALAAPLAVAVFLALTPSQYRAEAQLFVAAPVAVTAAEAASQFASLAGEAKLIASRDLGRRVIKQLGIDERREFDPVAGGVGPVAHTLIRLGLMGDPERVSQDERVLKSYEDRLSVSASDAERLVTIAFRSRDRAFAAEAANRIASLYLAARAKAGAGEGGGNQPLVSAHLLQPAITPRRPVLPSQRLTLAIAAGAALIAAFGFGAFRRTPRRAQSDEPVTPPRSVGDAPMFVRLKDVPRPFPEARLNAASRRAEADNAQALDDIAARILSARRPASGLRIVGARLSSAHAAPGVMLDLARLLGSEGRSIFVGLDGADTALPAGGANLGDLLANRASFAEVIRRDPRSRLHFVAPGVDGEMDMPELSSVVDALARTYDFIFMPAPALDASDIALALAANADFVVLAGPPDGAIAKAKADFFASGARDVLVIGAPVPRRQAFGQDAA